MSFRAEVNIPVTKDPRTFEERRNDMMTKLENSYHHTSSSKSIGGDSDKTTVSTMRTGSHTSGDRWLPENSWDHQRSRWIEEARRDFDLDNKSLRNSMFTLEPMDNFDRATWDNFGNSFRVNKPSSLMEQMDRRMEEMRRQMDSTMRISGSSMPESQKSSSHFSSSSSRTLNEGGVLSHTTATSSTSRQNIDGVITGTQSESKTEDSGRLGSGLLDRNLNRSIGHGSSIHSLSSPGSVDFLSNAFEVGDDGLVHFKIRFDAKDFSPEDIDVNTVGNRLTVYAKSSKKSSDSNCSREFSRTIDLPRSIDHDKFQCSLTEDGVLILDAPVNAPDYSSITFDSGHHLGIRPKDASFISDIDSRGFISDRLGPTIVSDGAGGKKLHLEVPIDEGYTSKDICVRMDANKICVSGKRERMADKSHGTMSSVSQFQSSQFDEFSRSFEVPETIDPFSITAVLRNNVLIIEAPLQANI